MKAHVNKDICIGCGACTVIADNVFEIGEDGLAQVKEEYTDTDVKEEDKDSVIDAREGCPVSAIDTEG